MFLHPIIPILFGRIPILKAPHLTKLVKKNKQPHTVKPPCATTSSKQPLTQNNNIFPVKSLHLRISHKWPPLVSNCNHFLGWQFNNVSLFLSLCKWPLNAWFVPYVRWMCYTTFINRVRKESLVSTWNYTYCNLEIACNESLSKCRCFQTFSRKRLLWINSRDRPPSLKQPLNLRILGCHFW